MKTAAIITIWDMGNYGNRLQNYAVTKIVHDKGLRPITLVSSKRQVLNIHKLIKYKLWHLIYVLTNGKKRIVGERIYNFACFTKRYIPHKHIDVSDIKETGYDYVFIGSDQIWNAKYVEPSDFVYGQAIDPERLVCISPSFGVASFFPEIEKRIGDYLKRIKHLNVREDEGAQIIKRTTGRDVPVFVDPTLMISSDDWSKIEKRPRDFAEKKYILKYFLESETEESINDTKRLCEEHGYEIVELLNDKTPDFVSGPSEFIYLIHHAEMIFTNSFHASVFSILFKKPFWTYSRADGKMNSRLETLFKLLNVDNRYEHDKNNPFKINYTKIDSSLKYERDRYNKFLDGILNKD